MGIHNLENPRLLTRYKLVSDGIRAATAPEKPILGIKGLTLESLRDLILAKRLLDDFERTGEISIMRQLIATLDNVSHLLEAQPRRLHTFVAGLLNAYRSHRQEECHSAALRLSLKALALCPNGHPDQEESGKLFGLALRARASSHIEECIVTLQAGLLEHKPGSSDWFKLLGDFVGPLIVKCRVMANMVASTDAITVLLDAVSSYTPCRFESSLKLSEDLNTLSRLMLKSHHKSGRRADLEKAISLQKYSISMDYRPQHDHAKRLGALANELAGWYNKTKCTADLDPAIELFQEALELGPTSEDIRTAYQETLASLLHNRYIRSEDSSDLDWAITLHRAALSSPLEPEKHFEYLRRFASSLRAKFASSGDRSDLEELISINKTALSLLPEQIKHEEKLDFLKSVFACYKIRLNRFGDVNLFEVSPSNLEVAIVNPMEYSHSHSSPHLVRESHSMKIDVAKEATMANNKVAQSSVKLVPSPRRQPGGLQEIKDLAENKEALYWSRREAAALDDAIFLRREILSSTTAGQHQLHTLSLASLGALLHSRYQRYGQIKDLKESVNLHRDSLKFHHESRIFPLSSLASALYSNHKRYGERKDLEEAILLLREALALYPDHHPDRFIALYNLSVLLSVLCERASKSKEALQRQAIELQKEGLSRCPVEHAHRPAAHLNLANLILSRGNDELRDTDVSIHHYKKALSQSPPRHPYRGIILTNLANALKKKFRTSPAPSTPILLEIQEYVLEAVGDPFLKASSRFKIAQRWANDDCMAQSFRLDMHSRGLDIVKQLLLYNPSLSGRQTDVHRNQEIRDWASNAAGYAIETGNLEKAIVWLDQGRSLLLGALKKNRSSLTLIDTLQDRRPDLAAGLALVATQLEEHAMMYEQPEPLHNTSFHDAYRTQRNLVDKWEEQLTEIRSIAGFKHFLSTPSYDELREAASQGPVIFLNSNPSSGKCDALIMYHSDPPSHVPLHGLSSKDVGLANFVLMFEKNSLNPSRQRKGIRGVAQALWQAVVSPIVQHLRTSKIKRGSRIWWCPCSSFNGLPIHAAGLYGRNSPPRSILMDHYFSSYTATASDLLAARNRKAPSNPSRFGTLFVGHSGGGAKLSLKKELNSVPTGNIEPLLEEKALPNTVLSNLEECSWVHMTCHGVSKEDDPLSSYFRLERGHLLVKDIIQKRLQGAEFAFLSACHSAGSSFWIGDENLHLASAMQFIGFRSVVGTMWEMYDRDGPEIVKDFYSKLMSPELGKYTDAAAALHHAIRMCRARGAGPERWAMFIHIGA